jgi:type IV secretory pathway VirB2 component (pilin)
MSETCTQTGNAQCAIDCQCATQSSQLNKSNPIQKQVNSTWQTLRSGLAFAVACIASPCCTPIIVAIAIALLAGSPVAAWLTLNIGWVYGILTLMSVVSFVLAIRWWLGKPASKPAARNSVVMKVSK